eukprot:539338_1
MKRKKQILLLTAGLIVIGTQIKPLLNSSLISEELRKKINDNVYILTNQINSLLTSAASTLAESYKSIKIGGNGNKNLLSKLSLLLLMAKIGIKRLLLILLILTSIHTISNNQSFINQIENIEQYIFPKPFLSKIISQYPKTMDQLENFTKIYWDVSEKAANAISAIFGALTNPKESGISDTLRTVEGVIKTIKDMKMFENLDLPKIMKMIQMMTALNKTNKRKSKLKIKQKSRL